MAVPPTGRRRTLLVGVVLSTTIGVAYFSLRDREDGLAMLAAASDGWRVIEPRLTGGFTHAPLVQTRSAVRPPIDKTLELAALHAERAAQLYPNATNLGVAGKAALLTGDAQRAVEHLEAATRLQPQSPELWSDLAAAYLVRAGADMPADTIRGLNAALRAQKQKPDLVEARFNVAVALEANNLAPEAHAAWTVYRGLDRDSPWSMEAAERLRRPPSETWADLRARMLSNSHDRAAEALAVERFPHAVRELIEEQLLLDWARTASSHTGPACAIFQQARRLAQALDASGADASARQFLSDLSKGVSCPTPPAALAKGLPLYVKARWLMTQADFAASQPMFDEAARVLERPLPTIAAWSRVHAAYVRYQGGDLDGSAARAAQIADFARARALPALRARALFVQALSLRDLGRPDQSLELCAESIRVSERIREAFHARATARAAADIARSAGDDGESWRLTVRSLASIEDEPSPVRRYLSYFNAALFARSSQLLEAALAFQNAALRSARVAAGTGAFSQALGHRAYLYFLLGRPADAASDLAQAREELSRVTASPHAYYEAELNAIDAAMRMASDPRGARRLLEAAYAVFVQIAPEQVPDASVALGRAALMSGDRTAARRALLDGIAFFESRRTRIADEDARISFFGTARDLYRDVIALLLDDSNEIDALRFADRIKGRALSEWSRPHASRESLVLNPAEIGAAIGNEAVFVSYLFSRDHLTSWLVNGEGRLQSERRRMDSDGVDRLQSALRSAFTSADRERESAAELYDLLIAPVRRAYPDAKTLYLALDGAIHTVPFAQLLDRASGRRLIEDVALVTVPSATWLIEARARATDTRLQAVELLAIGNPSNTGGDHALPPLPAAEIEAMRIAEMYPAPRLLRGPGATRNAVLRHAPQARVLHFAGHAIQNGVSPALSHLLLARESATDDGRLRAPDIAALDLDATALVVLGACSTARGVVRFGEGPMTLARPFLAAGAASVVATLWDVEDRPTATLLTAVHRALRLGSRPADALRAAQLEMLHSPDPSDRLPRHWGALAVFGANTPVFSGPRKLPGDMNE